MNLELRSQTHPRTANYANRNFAYCEINRFAATAKTDCLIAFCSRRLSNKQQIPKANVSQNIGRATVFTELLQTLEAKDLLLAAALPRAEVQSRACQHEPAGSPVVKVVTFFVVQPANQLAAPAHQRLHRRRDEALRVTKRKDRFTPTAASRLNATLNRPGGGLPCQGEVDGPRRGRTDAVPPAPTVVRNKEMKQTT